MIGRQEIRNSAYLIGISQYPAHTIKGVPNDLPLLARALEHHGYTRDEIRLYLDTHTTRAALHDPLREIREQYVNAERGICYLHIGASGILSLEPLAGGVLPTDGNELDFSTGLPFGALNEYLPVRDGIRVIVTLDT